MDVDPSVDPIEVCARWSLEPNRMEDVEGRESELGGGGFRDSGR
jgi:hypothetical protein